VRVVGWDEPGSIALLALFGLGGFLVLVFTGLAVLVTRRPSRRRRLKILVAAVAGGVCGTLWVLFVSMILDAARSGTPMDLPLVALGVVVALSAAVLLSGSGRSREVAGRSLMTTGFNSLALPIAALISFLVGGAQVPAGSAGAELSAVILGVRLAGSVATVGLSVGGLLAGVFLVFLGDRLLQQARQARRGRADAAATTVIQGPSLH
jgi:hypothetical protein